MFGSPEELEKKAKAERMAKEMAIRYTLSMRNMRDREFAHITEKFNQTTHDVAAIDDNLWTVCVRQEKVRNLERLELLKNLTGDSKQEDEDFRRGQNFDPVHGACHIF